MAKEEPSAESTGHQPPSGELQLLVKPVSGRCNLACRYCFYRPVKKALYPDAAVMSHEVLEEMIRQYLGMGLRQSSFSWQGGEPTLAGVEFFEEAVRLMMKHGRGGQSVGNAFQTNGILIDERWSEFLTKYRFLVGISLDGPRDVHERYRGKSFDKVVQATRTAMRLGVDVNVLACVSRASEGRGTEVYEFLKQVGFAHMQFIPVVEFVDKPGDIAEFSCRPEAYGDFLIEVFEAWKADPQPACNRLFDALVARAGTGRSSFCVLDETCANYVVVEATGDVYPCDFFVREGQKIGNLLDTRLATSRETPLVEEFMKHKPAKPEKCRECEWWTICHGGCLKEREAAGGLDHPTHFCEGMKRFLAHAWSHFEGIAREHFDEHGRPKMLAHAHDSQPDASVHGGGQAPPRGAGPQPPARKPRANEPCPCGSGRKYKRCCGRRK